MKILKTELNGNVLIVTDVRDILDDMNDLEIQHYELKQKIDYEKCWNIFKNQLKEALKEEKRGS